jgi:hypothetical protein
MEMKFVFAPLGMLLPGRPLLETMNAAAVLQVPLAVFVWDDGYGISVPKKYQTTKALFHEALSGLQKQEDTIWHGYL